MLPFSDQGTKTRRPVSEYDNNFMRDICVNFLKIMLSSNNVESAFERVTFPLLQSHNSCAKMFFRLTSLEQSYFVNNGTDLISTVSDLLKWLFRTNLPIFTNPKYQATVVFFCRRPSTKNTLFLQFFSLGIS